MVDGLPGGELVVEYDRVGVETLKEAVDEDEWHALRCRSLECLGV
jgi:hypothetical protein